MNLKREMCIQEFKVPALAVVYISCVKEVCS